MAFTQCQMHLVVKKFGIQIDALESWNDKFTINNIMTSTIILLLVCFIFIVAVVYKLNHKIIDHAESTKTAEQEQAIIDDSAEEPIDVDVIELNEKVKKVVAKMKATPVVEKKKSKRGRKPTRKAQNNADLSA